MTTVVIGSEITVHRRGLENCSVGTNAAENIQCLHGRTGAITHPPLLGISRGHYGGTMAGHEVVLTYVRSVPVPGVIMLKPLPATISEESPRNYVAKAPVVRAAASGDSREQALANLQDTIGHLFVRLSTLDSSVLGERARTQKSALARHLMRQADGSTL